MRVLLPGLLGFALLALWLYCIFDVILADSMLVRNLPKTMWLILVIIVPTVGAVAWLILGRPMHVGWRPGSTGSYVPPVERQHTLPATGRPKHLTAAAGPAELGSGGMSAAALQAWEDDLARRERELRQKLAELDQG